MNDGKLTDTYYIIEASGKYLHSIIPNKDKYCLNKISISSTNNETDIISLSMLTKDLNKITKAKKFWVFNGSFYPDKKNTENSLNASVLAAMSISSGKDNIINCAVMINEEMQILNKMPNTGYNNAIAPISTETHKIQ